MKVAIEVKRAGDEDVRCKLRVGGEAVVGAEAAEGEGEGEGGARARRAEI